MNKSKIFKLRIKQKDKNANILKKEHQIFKKWLIRYKIISSRDKIPYLVLINGIL